MKTVKSYSWQSITNVDVHSKHVNLFSTGGTAKKFSNKLSIVYAHTPRDSRQHLVGDVRQS